MTLPAAIETAFDNREIALALCAQFVFPEGTFGLWTGRGNLTVNSQVYKGVDRFLSFSGAKSQIGNVADGAAVQLSDVPSEYLDPDWQSALENYTYDNAPCNLTWVAFDPVTHAYLGIAAFRAYEIDTLVYRRSAIAEDGSFTVTVEAALESVARSITAATHVKRSDADQRRHNDPNDGGFRHAAAGRRFKIKFGKIAR